MATVRACRGHRMDARGERPDAAASTGKEARSGRPDHLERQRL